MSVRNAEDHRHDHGLLAAGPFGERAAGTGPGAGGHPGGPFTFAGLIARVQALNRRGR